MTTAAEDLHDQAERAVLGACLLSEKAITDTSPILTSADFYRPHHATIYAVVVSMWAAGRPVDLVTVTGALIDTGDINRCGGAPYLSRLVNEVPAVESATHYARQVADRAVVRRLNTVGVQLQRAADIDDATDRQTVLDRAVADLDGMVAILRGQGRDAPPGATWRAVDIGPVLAGDVKAAEPTIGSRDDGQAILYPGKLHTIAGESESGKTWFCAAIIDSEIRAAHHVVIIDPEDDARGWIGRLMLLTTADRTRIADHVTYIQPEEPMPGAGWRSLQPILLRTRPTVIVVDGITAAMSLHGFDPLSNADVAQFGSEVLRPLTQSGAAVLVTDHVPKAGANGRYAIGAAHKLNGVDGAAFMIEARRPFSVGVAGRSTLFLAKDRPGLQRQHGRPAKDGLTYWGDLTIESLEGRYVELGIKPPPPPEDVAAQSERPRPTIIMERVSKAVEGAKEPLTTRLLRARVQGKGVVIDQAVAALVDEGFLAIEPKGASRIHTLIRAFRVKGDTGPPTVDPDEGREDE